MAPKPSLPCAKYQYVLSASGVPKILPVPDSDCKDEESPADYNVGGYLPVKVDDTFKNGRYTVLRKLGWGHFSTVWLVKDTERRRHSALKVVKSAGRYAETARDEIKLLNQVAAANKSHPGREFIVSFLDSFTHTGPEASHICIVFEPLGENLLALIERNRAEGVPRQIVKAIAKQVLLGLMYLHDECDLVHTDIKPENIMVSIPDVEDHITSELTASPLPTSKHISVPPNNRTSRTGLSIPSARRSSRRSVQIFESQPLSSPGRRSGSNSVNGSYVAQMQMSRLSIQDSLGSKVPEIPPPPKFSKVPSPMVKQLNFATTVLGTPSTSSSSSSISLTSKAAQSVGSTPPTSVSHSIGSAALGLLAMAKQQQASELSDRTLIGGTPAKITAPMSIMKGKADSPSDSAMTGSWRDRLGLPASWKDKLPSSLRSNGSSNGSSSKAENRQTNGHARKESKAWKDPGTSTLAPAVVVSASATAGGEGDSDEFFLMPPASGETTRSSSTQVPTPKPQSGSRQPILSSRPLPSMIIPQPSLLTQTAPTHRLISTKRIDRRNSPALRTSHLSSQIQPHPLSSTRNEICLPVATGVPPLHTGADPPLPVSPAASVTPTPTSFPDSPSAPPPTPCTQSPVAVNFPHPLRSTFSPSQLPELFEHTPMIPPVSIKIADLGNATPSKRHYTEEIQTRQYRAPEAILGRRDWDARADVWSVACVLFELLAGEYLFDPRGQADLFTKDDDHMAQIIELMGDFPTEAKLGGRYSREIFDNTGQLRYIKTLKPWPLKRVLIEKYTFSETDAEALCEFLTPMLQPDFHDRKHARDLVDHPWLDIPADELFLGEW